MVPLLSMRHTHSHFSCSNIFDLTIHNYATDRRKRDEIRQESQTIFAEYLENVWAFLLSDCGWFIATNVHELINGIMVH